MQKWCPEAFVLDGAVHAVGASGTAFEPLPKNQPAKCPHDERTQRSFLPDSCHRNPQSVLANLTGAEKTALCEAMRVEMDHEFTERLAGVQADYETRLAAAENRFVDEFAGWADNFRQALGDLQRTTAANTARLAVTIAEKIIRRHVEVDEEVLVRAIETTLFKTNANSPLHLVVNPEDAAWLRDKTELLAKLNVATVREDRRIGKGGCRIENDSQEWDATIAGQLETMRELLEDALAAAEDLPPTKIGNENDNAVVD